MTDTQQATSFDELASRVDELRDRISHQDPAVAELLNETITAITDFNRAGLITLVQMLREDARGGEILYEAVDHPEVLALFVQHGMIRTDRTLDVLRVVEQIRPYLVASSISMQVDSVVDDVAFVKFEKGCSAPAQTVKDEIMGVLMQRVPGLKGVQEVVETPGAFVPVTSLRVGPPTS